MTRAARQPDRADGMVNLPDRPHEHWDKGDHLSFALAGLIREASVSLAEHLYADGVRGWVSGYPEQLAAKLERWTRMIREECGETPAEDAPEPVASEPPSTAEDLR